MRTLSLAVAALLAACMPAMSDSTGASATLAALAPLPPLTSEACLSGVTLTTSAAAAAGVTGAPYTLPYNTAAAQRTADIIDAAVATNDQTRAFGEVLPTSSAEAFLGFADFLTASGFSADHIVDLTAYYIVAITVAQTGNEDLLEDGTAITALRNQLSLGEANCRQIAAALDVMPDLGSHIIAHMGLLFEGLEEVEDTPDLASFQSTVSQLFGQQLAGRTLTAANGLQ